MFPLAKEIVLTFIGTHQAITAEKVLKEDNISLRVMALPSQIEAGCGLCIRVSVEEYERSMHILKQAQVQPEGSFLKTTEKGKIHYSSLQGYFDSE